MRNKTIKKKIILIGAAKYGKTADCGETMKNQIFIEQFKLFSDKLYLVDTYHWQKKPFILLKMLFFLTFCPSAKVVISSSSYSAYKLIKFLYFIRLKKSVYYWVIGGSFHKIIKNGTFKKKYFHYLKYIIVQGKIMKFELNKLGLNNCIYIPNSKPITFSPKEKIQNDFIHFVFLSRIDNAKGCNYIFESVNQLNKEGYSNKFTVDFFGKISKDYNNIFNKQVNFFSNTTYKGFLNLRDDSGYEKLSKYDAMLFPTFWEGEGFPGVVIDSYIAGVPVIASDWNLNKDVIINGKTGIIIPVNDIDALTKIMRSIIEKTLSIEKMRINCLEESKKYDSKLIISKKTLSNIELI